MEQYGFVDDVLIQEIKPSMQESTTTWDRLLREFTLLRLSEILPSLVSIKNASGLTSENGSIFLFPDPLWNGTREHVESLLREAQASSAARQAAQGVFTVAVVVTSRHHYRSLSR